MNQANPQNITIRGRLSWPTWTYAEAVKRNATSKYPKSDVNDVRPDFSLLLTEAQANKLITHLTDVFLPWCEEQGKTGDKSGLKPGEVKLIKRALEAQDWETEGVLGLIKPVHEKTAELAPEAVMTVSIKGFKGQDLEKKAVVRDESQLANPTDDIVIPERGIILPIRDTTLDLYPGSIVAATVNLFAFVSGKTPGITANTSTAVLVGEAERFGGGAVMDEDSIFMDDDEE